MEAVTLLGLTASISRVLLEYCWLYELQSKLGMLRLNWPTLGAGSLSDFSVMPLFYNSGETNWKFQKLLPLASRLKSDSSIPSEYSMPCSDISKRS